MKAIDKRDERHWLTDTYRQRMTTGQWKVMLLNHYDQVRYKGKLYKLEAKNLGYGVVEVYKGKRMEGSVI